MMPYHTPRINREMIYRVGTMGVGIAVLVALSRIHYLWFHTSVEFMSAVIGVSLYIIAASSYRFHGNSFLLFVSCAFFWSACLDIVHAMVFPGMGLSGGNFNLAPQLWVGARGIEAVTLLLSPLFLTRRPWDNWAFPVMGVVAIGWGGLVFADALPTFFIEGVGLTPVKKLLEYVIIAILLTAAGLIYRQRRQLPEGIGHLIFGVIAITIAAELCFTAFISMYDFSNLLRHVLKIVSYWLMLRIVLLTMIDKPFQVMSRDAYSFDSIPLPVLVLDSRGVIRSCNESARSAHPGGGVGQPLHDVWHQKITRPRPVRSVPPWRRGGNSPATSWAITGRAGSAWFCIRSGTAASGPVASCAS